VKERIRKVVFWMVWSRVGVQLVSFASTIFVARLLAPADYGLVVMAGVWTGTLMMITEVGMGAAIVQYQDLTRDELDDCFWFTLATTVLMYLALFAAAPAIARVVAMPALVAVLRVLGLIVPLSGLRVVPESLLRKRLEFDRLVRAELASRVLGIPLVVSLALAGFGAWALVAVGVFSPLVMTSACYLMVRWWPRLPTGAGRLREMVRFGATTMGTRLCSATYQQSDSLILGAVGGQVALGVLSMAKTLALLPVEKISATVNEVALPLMAILRDDRAAMRRSFLRALRLVACTTAPLCLAAAVTADDEIAIALGAKWAPVVPLMRVFCVYAVIKCIDVLLPPVLLARDRAGFLFRYVIALLIVMPVVFYGGAALLGGLGVAVAWLLFYPPIVLRMASEALAELDLRWRDVGRELLPLAVALIATALVMLSVRAMLPGSEKEPTIVRGASSLIAGGVAFISIVMLRGGVMAKEVTQVAAWVVGRGHAVEVAK